MSEKFNKILWDLGRKIEDTSLPILNKFFDCKFERNENDIWDVLDFKDHDKKIIVEVKGRRITSTHYKETIITASKVSAGYQSIDQGFKVFFVFVFTDKMMYIELLEGSEFQVKFTGTNCIQHFLIPIEELIELETEDKNSIYDEKK